MRWPEIRDRIRTYLTRMVRKTTLGTSSGDGKSDQATGYERGAQDPDYGFGATRMQHYGFISRVPVGAEIVALAINGGTNNRVYVASDLAGSAPALANEGEAALYTKFGQKVVLNAAGEVVVNEGTHKVARVGDAVSVKIYYTTAVVSGTTVITSISGVAGPNVETLTGTISDNGAVKFKA